MNTSRECPPDLLFFCKLLSPWTTEEEVLRLREASKSREVDWEAVAVLANRANLAPALHHALTTRDLFEAVPVELREYLGEMYRFNTRRNQLLAQELFEILGLLNRAGISPMPLKGAAVLASTLYADPAVRFMWDLDLLVPVGSIGKAVDVLQKEGYFIPPKYSAQAASRTDWTRVKHYLPLIREGAVAEVELHRQVVSDEWVTLLKTEAVWGESTESTYRGLDLAMMSPTHQIIHCFIHSELDHMNHRRRRLNLRQLHHFAHLCRSFQQTTDWNRVAMILEERRTGRVLASYLHLADALFGVETPLSAKAESYARHHLSKSIRLMNGRWKRMRILGEIIEDLIWCVSQERMNRRCLAEDDRSAIGRRAHHLQRLLRRYARIKPWKEKVRAIGRKYDSLG